MADREKLIDLLDHATRIFRFDSWENTDKIADYLLSNGIRLESKQATSNENKRWIPVTERLPEHEDAVLCFLKNGQQEILQLDKFENLWVGMQWKYKRHAVTHWMPLPEPPKEENNEA